MLKEGWLTLFKSRKTGIFNSKPAVSWGREREGGREGGGGREKEEEGRGKNGEERIAKFGIFYIFCILIWCLG